MPRGEGHAGSCSLGFQPAIFFSRQKLHCKLQGQITSCDMAFRESKSSKLKREFKRSSPVRSAHDRHPPYLFAGPARRLSRMKLRIKLSSSVNNSPSMMTGISLRRCSISSEKVLF